MHIQDQRLIMAVLCVVCLSLYISLFRAVVGFLVEVVEPTIPLSDQIWVLVVVDLRTSILLPAFRLEQRNLLVAVLFLADQEQMALLHCMRALYRRLVILQL